MKQKRMPMLPVGCSQLLRPAMFATILLALLMTAPALAQTAYHQPTPFPAGVTNGVHVADCWTTNVYYGTICTLDDKLQFGGWGDVYRSYIRFDTSGLPKRGHQGVVVAYQLPPRATIQRLPRQPSSRCWASGAQPR